MISTLNAELGRQHPPATWASLNRDEASANPEIAANVALFPAVALMQEVCGLTNERDFTSHGADFWLALCGCAPKPLSEYGSVLDFGCESGRLARMLKGNPGSIHGCDIDARHVAWTSSNLPYVTASRTEPDQPLPYAGAQFELVVSKSDFTHLGETSQDLMLSELARITRAGSLLLLTIHGERAMERTLSEQIAWDMAMDRGLFEEARGSSKLGGMR